MALTATATKKLRNEVCKILGMSDPVEIDVSREKPNIFFLVSTSQL